MIASSGFGTSLRGSGYLPFKFLMVPAMLNFPLLYHALRAVRFEILSNYNIQLCHLHQHIFSFCTLIRYNLRGFRLPLYIGYRYYGNDSAGQVAIRTGSEIEHTHIDSKKLRFSWPRPAVYQLHHALYLQGSARFAINHLCIDRLQAILFLQKTPHFY
jgi:hypothetical protein